MDYNSQEWYTPVQARERLEQNSGKSLPESYVRKLVEKNLVKSLKLSDRYKLYWKADIDNYVVEDRGKKAARAMRGRKKSEQFSETSKID